MNNPIRSFIAIELSEEFRRFLAQAQSEIKKLDLDAKWVNQQIAHLTLKFLGNVPHQKMVSVIKIFQNPLQGIKPFAIEAAQLGVFPNIEFPQIIWLGLSGDIPMIQNLIAILEDNFAKLGIAKERRDFQAHITLGRLKSKKNIPALAEFLRKSTILIRPQQTVDHITLFKSTLTSLGPVYEVLTRIQLLP